MSNHTSGDIFVIVIYKEMTKMQLLMKQQSSMIPCSAYLVILESYQEKFTFNQADSNRSATELIASSVPVVPNAANNISANQTTRM